MKLNSQLVGAYMPALTSPDQSLAAPLSLCAQLVQLFSTYSIAGNLVLRGSLGSQILQ
jgi:hypothetical protein